jgi:hypothetical protein
MTLTSTAGGETTSEGTNMQKKSGEEDDISKKYNK